MTASTLVLQTLRESLQAVTYAAVAVCDAHARAFARRELGRQDPEVAELVQRRLVANLRLDGKVGAAAKRLRESWSVVLPLLKDPDRFDHELSAALARLPAVLRDLCPFAVELPTTPCPVHVPLEQLGAAERAVVENYRATIAAIEVAADELLAAIRRAEPAQEESDNSVSLTPNEQSVLKTLAVFDASRLVSGEDIADAMDPNARLSVRKILPTVNRLIGIGLAERPQGKHSGARLTVRGRRLAAKIAD